MIRFCFAAPMIAMLTLGVVSVAVADPAPTENHMQVGVDSYGWKEYSANGTGGVSESGSLLSLGDGWDDLRRIDSGPIYGADGNIYFGRVNYSGYSQNLQTGTQTPLSSTANYYGLHVAGLGGYRFARDLLGLDLFGGGVLDFWNRSIANATDANGTPTSGYTEDYTILDLKFGTGLFQEMGSWSYRFEIGAKYPIYILEHVNLYDGLNLSPGKKASAFAKLNFELGPEFRNHFGLILSYDSYRFSPSALKMLTNGGVPVTDQNGNPLYGYQPESDQDVYRISLAYYFR